MSNDNENAGSGTGNEETTGGGKSVDLVLVAQNAINKARREEAQKKVNELTKKLYEVEKSAKLIIAERKQVIDDYNSGL